VKVPQENYSEKGRKSQEPGLPGALSHIRGRKKDVYGCGKRGETLSFKKRSQKNERMIYLVEIKAPKTEHRNEVGNEEGGRERKGNPGRWGNRVMIREGLLGSKSLFSLAKFSSLGME